MCGLQQQTANCHSFGNSHPFAEPQNSRSVYCFTECILPARIWQ